MKRLFLVSCGLAALAGGLAIDVAATTSAVANHALGTPPVSTRCASIGGSSVAVSSTGQAQVTIGYVYVPGTACLPPVPPIMAVDG